MPVWLKFILQIIFFSIVVIVGYTALKIYVLDKLKINKWIVFALSIFVLLFPVLIKVNINNTIWQYVQSAIVIILTLWFLDLMGIGGGKPRNKKNDMVIKPKAKPNRAKNMKKEDNSNNKKNKKNK